MNELKMVKLDNEITKHVIQKKYYTKKKLCALLLTYVFFF